MPKEDDGQLGSLWPGQGGERASPQWTCSDRRWEARTPAPPPRWAQPRRQPLHNHGHGQPAAAAVVVVDAVRPAERRRVVKEVVARQRRARLRSQGVDAPSVAAADRRRSLDPVRDDVIVSSPASRRCRCRASSTPRRGQPKDRPTRANDRRRRLSLAKRLRHYNPPRPHAATWHQAELTARRCSIDYRGTSRSQLSLGSAA